MIFINLREIIFAVHQISKISRGFISFPLIHQLQFVADVYDVYNSEFYKKFFFSMKSFFYLWKVFFIFEKFFLSLKSFFYLWKVEKYIKNEFKENNEYIEFILSCGLCSIKIHIMSTKWSNENPILIWQNYKKFC